jgi:periplasmic divalent cation tolerance protein
MPQNFCLFVLFFSAHSAPLRYALFLPQIHYNIPDTPMPTQFRLVLVTCSSLTEARKISRSLLQEHLAACVNIHTTPVESIYRWKGKIETVREHLLLIKTTTRRLKSLEREVLRLHSYEIPEFLVLPMSSGSQAYLRWLSDSCKK